MPSYLIRLEKFHIHVTRSPFNDTDLVTFSFARNGQPDSASPQHKDMGNVSDGGSTHGDHEVGLQYGPVEVNDADEVTFSYSIANAGYDRSHTGDAASALNGLGDLCEKLCSGVFGYQAVWKAVNVGLHFISKVFFAKCDGLVASDAIQFTGADIASKTAATGTYSETRRYPGTDSANGCGSNSDYMVTWSITSQ